MVMREIKIHSLQMISKCPTTVDDENFLLPIRACLKMPAPCLNN